MYKKNTSVSADRYVHFQLVNKSDGTPVTSGTTTLNIFQNNALLRTTSVTSGSNHLGNGVWFFQLTQTDINSNTVSIGTSHANAIPSIISIKTADYSTLDIYNGITGLIAGVNVTEVDGVGVSIADFRADVSGLSTFGVDGTFYISVGQPYVDCNIEQVNSVGVTIGDFRATGITATIDGIIPVNVIQIASTAISALDDIYTSTSGLSTFNAATDYVFIATSGLDDISITTAATTKITNSIFSNIVDGTVTFDTAMEMLIAFMSGKVTVTDSGSQRYFQFYKRNGSSVSFGITASELDSQEGQRSNTGYIA